MKNDMTNLYAFVPFSIIIFLLYGTFLFIGRNGVLDEEKCSFLNYNASEQIQGNRFKFSDRFKSFVWNKGTAVVLFVNYLIIMITLLVIDPNGKWGFPSLGNYVIIALFIVYPIVCVMTWLSGTFDSMIGLPILHNVLYSSIKEYKDSGIQVKGIDDFDFTFLLEKFSLRDTKTIQQFVESIGGNNMFYITSTGEKAGGEKAESEKKADGEKLKKDRFVRLLLKVLVDKFYIGNGVFFILMNIFLIYCVLILNDKFIFTPEKMNVDADVEIDRSPVTDADEKISNAKKQANDKKSEVDIDVNNVDVNNLFSKDAIPDNLNADNLTNFDKINI